MAFTFVVMSLAAIAIWAAPLLKWRLRGTWPPLRSAIQMQLLRGGALAILLFLFIQGGVLRYSVLAKQPVILDVLVDVSQSVADPARGAQPSSYLAEVAAMVARLREQGTPLEVRVHPFAGVVGAPVADPADLRIDTTILQPWSSDITGAVERAMAAPEDGRRHAILLVTDGWQSRDGVQIGDMNQRILTLAGQRSIPILVLPAGPDRRWWEKDDSLVRFREVLIDADQGLGAYGIGLSLQAPFPERGATGFLGLSLDDQRMFLQDVICANQMLGRQYAVALPPADDTGPLTMTCDPIYLHLSRPDQLQGQHQLTVSLSPRPLDQLPHNVLPPGSDSVSRFIAAPGKIRVLVADGQDQPPPILTELLTGGAWEVETKAGPDMGNVDFARYDLVVLSDLGPYRLGKDRDKIIAALAAYVRKGGGLVVSGGAETFGQNGYGGTPLADVLPVQVTPKGSSGTPPMTVVVVLDVSASLFYSQPTFDRAVDYILESVEPLTADSQVRVLGFSSEPHELMQLAPFRSRADFKARLKAALGNLRDRFAQRVKYGLPPIGITLQPAIKAAAGTFADRPPSPHNRILLVADAADIDQERAYGWWVTEAGEIRHQTAAQLAAELSAQYGVITNAISMVAGPGPLRKPLKGEDEKRVQIAATGHGLLQEIATAGKGTAYLDLYGIPLGEMSRPMRDYSTIVRSVRIDPLHPFLEGLWQAEGHVPQIDGYAIVLPKDRAETAMLTLHETDSQAARELPLWANWLVSEPPKLMDGRIVGQAAFGGRVVTFITSLRSVRLDEVTRGSFGTSWLRAMAWARRDRPQDRLVVTGGRTSDGVLLRVELDSTEPGSASSVTAILDGGKHRIPFVFDGAGRWEATLPLGEKPPVHEVAIEATVVRGEGRVDTVPDLIRVAPATLAPVRETIPFRTGPNLHFLTSLAEATGGAVLNWGEPRLPDNLTAGEATEVVREVNLRWAAVLAFAIFILGELVLRMVVGEEKAKWAR